jgi:hypothetical protein
MTKTLNQETPFEFGLTKAAQLSGLNRGTVWHHIVHRNLRARQVGAIWIIRRDDFQELLRDRKQQS